MRFYDVGMRPSDRRRRGIDFTNDLSAGDTIVSSSVAAATQDEPDIDLTATNLELKTLAGNVLSVRIKTPPVNKDLIVFYSVTTAAGDDFNHDILIPISASA